MVDRCTLQERTFLRSLTAGGTTRTIWIQAQVRTTRNLQLEQAEGLRGTGRGNQCAREQTLTGIFKESGFKYLMSGVNIEVVCFLLFKQNVLYACESDVYFCKIYESLCEYFLTK